MAKDGSQRERKNHVAVGMRSRAALEALEPRMLLTAVSWIAATSGDFNNPANWSDDKVPGASDDVTINAPSIQVTLSNESQTVNSLKTSASMDLLNSNLGVVGSGLTLVDGPTITDSSSGITFGNAAFGGTGTVDFAGGGSIYVGGGGTLTIGSGITIQGGSGSVTTAGEGETLNNQATVIANTPGETITFGAGLIGLSTVINSGPLSAAGGELQIDGQWTNTGSISVSGAGILNLYNVDTTSVVSNLTRDGGTVNIVGPLYNSGCTLALDPATTGSWDLFGPILFGTITSTGGAQLICAASGPELDGVTLGPGSPLDVATYSATLDIEDGLTLSNSTIDVGGGTITTGGTQTIDGSGTITLGAGGSFNIGAYGEPTVGNALTLSPNITVNGVGGAITLYNSTDTLINEGTISDNASGVLTLVTNGGTFSNAGILEASNGGSLSIQGDCTMAAQGSVDIGIGPGGTGTVAVSGTANLAGALNASLVDNFVPPINQTYDLLTYASSAGAFSAINTPQSDAVAFATAAGPMALTLTTSLPLPPAASISAPDVTAAGSAAESVTVVYADNIALSAASITTGNITVAGPAGNLGVTAVSITPNTDAATITVVYTIPAPIGGWAPADNGVYVVSLLAGQVTNASGDAAAATQASFTVSVPVPVGTAVGGKKPVTFDNHAIKLYATGGAVAVFQTGDRFDLTLTPARANGAMTVTAHGGSWTLGAITTAGAVRLTRFIAPDASLAGSMTIDGAIGTLNLSNIAGSVVADSIARLTANSVSGAVTTKGAMGAVKLNALTSIIGAGTTIGNFTAASVTAAKILAGAYLGVSARIGDPDELLGSGSIFAMVLGSISDSFIGAGVNPVDGVFGNGNDAAEKGVDKIGAFRTKTAPGARVIIEAGSFPKKVQLPGSIAPGLNHSFVPLG